MKKSLLALAVLGAFAGAASAQSSVTLFGVVDLSVNYQKTNNANGRAGQRIITEDSNQLNSNRLGFRGIEDLGGGLKAGFWIEAGMSNDTGAGAATGGGLSFNRRSTVSLIGGFGEVRLGRDYTPTFWNTVLYDVYGANGLGQADNMTIYARGALGSGATSTVRANNSVTYFLPSNIGGFYGRVMVAGSEGVSGQKFYGGSLNWAGGPLDVGGGYSTTKIINGTSANLKTYNAGASYDFGVAKLYALYNVSDYSPRKLKTAEVSVGIPVGVGAVNASYTHGSYSGTTIGADTGKGDQLSAQYIYNLSKRTALYGTLAYIRNRSGANFAFGDVPVFAGQNVRGANVGVRHSF